MTLIRSFTYDRAACSRARVARALTDFNSTGVVL